VACDAVILRWWRGELSVLLIERGHGPYLGRWALPGGFVEKAEGLEAAAAREVKEETGIDVASLFQLGAYGDPERDPRGRVISVAFLALLPPREVESRAGSDARRAEWFPFLEPPALAFDHARILADAASRLRELILLTPAPLAALLPEAFPREEFLAFCCQAMRRSYAARAFYAWMRRMPALARVPGREQEVFRFDPGHDRMRDIIFLAGEGEI
jgi:8-oxo-dGTP diphosphatase